MLELHPVVVDEPEDQTPTEVLTQVYARAEVAAPQRARGANAAKLRAQVVSALAAGWAPDLLVAALSGPFDLAGGRNTFGQMRYRLRELGPPPAEGPLNTGRSLDWCGKCHPTTRQLEDPVTAAPLGRCPTCHPSLLTRTGSR